MAFLIMGVAAVVGTAVFLAWMQSTREQRLTAASTTELHVDEHGVERRMADGRVEKIAWCDLTGVEVITTATGVHRDDGALVVLAVDDTHGCLVPSRLAAERGVIERLSRLPGFDTRRLAEALDEPPPSRTTCWTRR